MTVYVVIVEDRHSDVDVEVWMDESKAIARGKEIALSCVNDPSEIEEYLTDPMIKSGWLYNAVYSCGSDSVSVQRKETR